MQIEEAGGRPQKPEAGGVLTGYKKVKHTIFKFCTFQICTSYNCTIWYSKSKRKRKIWLSFCDEIYDFHFCERKIWLSLLWQVSAIDTGLQDVRTFTVNKASITKVDICHQDFPHLWENLDLFEDPSPPWLAIIWNCIHSFVHISRWPFSSPHWPMARRPEWLTESRWRGPSSLRGSRWESILRLKSDSILILKYGICFQITYFLHCSYSWESLRCLWLPRR